MARITVRLGAAYIHKPEFTIDGDDIDRDDPGLPDLVFAAANRIDRVDVDVDRLELASQKRIRRLIDQFQAPSMAPGDEIVVVLDGGLRERTFTCLPVGWAVTDTEVIINKSKPEEAHHDHSSDPTD